MTRSHVGARTRVRHAGLSRHRGGHRAGYRQRGRLAAGDQLPPQRDLARALSLNLSSVTKAYRLAFELGPGQWRDRARHLRAGRRSRAHPLALGREASISIDFASNFPMPLDPSEEVGARALPGHGALRCRPAGCSNMRRAARSATTSRPPAPLAGRARRAGTPDGILLTSGAINGVFACLLGLAKAGEIGALRGADLAWPHQLCADDGAASSVGVPMDRRRHADRRLRAHRGRDRRARVAVLSPDPAQSDA